LDESDAFPRFQKLANAENLKLMRIAEMILAAEKAMQ